MSTLEQIQQVEDRLMKAQIASNVDELDDLLANDLLAIGPDGQMISKADDLTAHRTHVFRIEAMTRLELTIKLLPDIAIAFVLMDVHGLIEDQPASGRYRYTRVWSNQSGRWQVIAAHISPTSN